MITTMQYGKSVWTPGPNFDSGRKGFRPTHIVIHGTASPNQDIDWWAARASTRGGVHYMVGRQPYTINGILTQVIQFVREEDTAWGNGIVDDGCVPWVTGANPNLYTISIEHVKFDPLNMDMCTAMEDTASFNLIRYLCLKWNIPMRLADAHGGIMTHAQIGPDRRWFCPGPYRWDRLFAYLQTGA